MRHTIEGKEREAEGGEGECKGGKGRREKKKKGINRFSRRGKEGGRRGEGERNGKGEGEGRDITAFGELLHEAWQAKRSLSSKVSNSFVEATSFRCGCVVLSDIANQDVSQVQLLFRHS